MMSVEHAPHISPPPPELLAPAGNWDCVRAAVENGADAIYFGLECGFNARARAANFSADDLPELADFLHRRNVRGYVTLNTLAFPSELDEVERLVRLIASSGIDAILVQDIGVARLAREICAELPLHASTQMTMTSAETIALAEQLNIERVVVARELSINEIRAIREETDMPLETFVHGALCVAYSGQCLTSESLGGRSANRGQCAQACRLAYELIADGVPRDLGDQQYLLSPQDLAAYELTPELLEAGICSLKIEGRLKSPEYVANITRHYRQAIDAAVAKQRVSMSPADKYEMEMSFSRGFSPGWLQGCDHKMLVPATSSAKQGVLAARVVSVRGNRIEVELLYPIEPGDGVVFQGDRTRNEDQGGRVYGVSKTESRNGSRAELTFARDAIDVGRVYTGQLIWKTDDPKLNQRLRKSYQVADPVRRVPVSLRVECVVGQPLRIVGVAANGARCEVVSDAPLQQARKHAIDTETLDQQLGRLGGTIFTLNKLDATIEGEPMVPFSVLGQVRRSMVRQLEAAVLATPRTLSPSNVLQRMRNNIREKAERGANENQNHEDASVGVSKTSLDNATLHVLCRTLEQVRCLSEQEANVPLYADFQDIREYGEAVATAQANGKQIWLATPRIQKPGELGIFRSLSKQQPNGYLVRNYSGLEFYRNQGAQVVADFSLNVANELTAEFLMDQGIASVTASYDLNRDQLFDLVSAVPSAWLEIVIHQHMPMFHMEHCVFCAVLSPGTNKTNCGRPCDTMKVELRDRIGMEHPLTADVGCRNTLWNATPQSSTEIVGDLIRKRVSNFRVELLRESGAEIMRTISLYRQLLDGDLRGKQVWQQLNANNRVGVTRGTLEERNPLAII